MDALPSSMVTAVALSAAAGKNPWLPLAMIFLLAAPDSVPALVMNPQLQGQLHTLAPVEALWTLGVVFAVLALADSLADKVGFIEKWFVPVSTAWRPFAGVACSTLIGVAAAREVADPETVQAMRSALTETSHAGLLVGGSIVAVTVGLAFVVNWIATMSKTGVRLLMTMVPIPGLKLLHSFVDDFFALGAVFAGFAFADTFVVPALIAIYLAVGVFTAPLLTRLTWIHVRIGWSILKKAARSRDEAAPRPPPPAWLGHWMQEHGLADAVALPAYVYRAPTVGWCRAGHLVMGPGRVAFVTRVWFRARAWEMDEARLARVGLCETTTGRAVNLVERLERDALREVTVTLFPAAESEVRPLLEEGASRAALVRVRPDSESARAALPGFADRGRSVRFLPEEDAGSLRLQGLITISTAIAVGVLTGGVFIPIGTGYLASPFKRRLVLGWLISGYLAVCVIGSAGIGWPAAVLYASVLNALTLRDQTRNAFKARVEGFVDRRAWLPLVAGRVWVPVAGLRSEADRALDSAAEETELSMASEGGWRAMVRLLADAPTPA